MGNPIFVLAGQSNAWTIADAFRDALVAKYGAGGFTLVEAHAPGAPLTYAKSGPDWATPGELPADLIDKTVAALLADPTARVAGFVWVQGEGDTYGFVDAAAYSDRFVHLLAGFEAGVEAAIGPRDSGIDTADVLLSTLSDHAPAAADLPLWDEIISEHQELAQSSPRISLIDPDTVAQQSGIAAGAMFRDLWHYDDGFAQHLAVSLVAALPDPGELQAGVGSPGETVLVGTAQDDVFNVSSSGVRVIEHASGGHDEVVSTVSFSLRDHSAFIEDLTLAGTADIDATGNGHGNVLVGNAGDNLLNGVWGDDTLIGGGGADTLHGGQGDDTYLAGPGDTIVEAAGRGTDLVISADSFSLRDHSQFLEHLTLTGGADIGATGNSAGNRITGNTGDNRLDGAWGDDTLIGGGGRDVLRGGQGDDTYHVDSRDDAVLEAAGRGHDHVFASADYALRDHSQHVEDLTLTGRGDIDATGNSMGNLITGNSGNNVIDGAWGRDTLIGGPGDDTLIGGQHADIFVVGTGQDHDRIEDFQYGTDQISLIGHDFGGGAGDTRAEFLTEHGDTVDGGDLVIDLGGGDTIYLRGIVDTAQIGDAPGDYLDILLL